MAYTLQDLQTSVLDDLKDPSFSATRITRYLNYGQLMIFNMRMLRFTQRAVSGSLTVGQFEYNQQADHQSTVGGVLIDPITNQPVFELNKRTYQAHREFFENYPAPATSSNARPSVWTEYGGQLYFNTPLDKAYVFNQRYYRFPTSLVASTDVPTVPEAFRELLELYAAFRAENYRGNFDIGRMLKSEFDEGLEAMVLRFSPTTNVAAPTMRGATRRTNATF